MIALHSRAPRTTVLALVVASVTACRSSPGGTEPAPAPRVSGDATPADAPAPAARSPGQDAYDQGFERAMAGDLDTALTLFRQATEIDPQLAVAWFDLAGLLEQRGDEPEALVAMQRAVDSQPRFVQARVELSWLILKVRDDEGGAMDQLRTALTTRDPFVVDRYPIARSRGEALHKLASLYGMRGFIGATVAIEDSLAGDPSADSQPASARVRDRAADDIEDDLRPNPAGRAALERLLQVTAATPHDAEVASVEMRPAVSGMTSGPAIDRFRAWTKLAELERVAGHLDRCDAALSEAATAAERLPLDRWLDTTAVRIDVALARGDQAAAARFFDSLAWLEYLTTYAPPPVGGRLRSRAVIGTPAFGPVRARPQVAAAINGLDLE